MTVTRGRVASYVSVVVHSAASLPRFATAKLSGTMAESVESWQTLAVSQAQQSGLHPSDHVA